MPGIKAQEHVSGTLPYNWLEVASPVGLLVKMGLVTKLDCL